MRKNACSVSSSGSTKSSNSFNSAEDLNYLFGHIGSNIVSDEIYINLLLSCHMGGGGAEQVATRLLSKFKSIDKIVKAPSEKLERIDGISTEHVLTIQFFRSIVSHMLSSRMSQRISIRTMSAVVDCCHFELAHQTREQFRVLFLDSRMRLIANEKLQEGTINHAPVYVREVIHRALALSANGMILVHNHPSGDPTPSRGDMEMTNRIVQAANCVEIEVHDHLIIGSEGHVSFKSLGLM